MAPINVGLIGGTGETGGAIAEGLFAAGGFNVVALTRPSSLSKPKAQALKKQGAELRVIDLHGSHSDLVEALYGIEILISAVDARSQLDQLPLVAAAKEAGIKRFLPCAFVTAMSAGGLHLLRDQKEVVYNAIKVAKLPFTIVDVGWWYQLAHPELPSGKIDYAIMLKGQNLPGDGNVPNAVTDLYDIGKYVAKIIVDDRTLNKSVLVYNDLLSPNQIVDIMEKLSGETIPRNYDSLETYQSRISANSATFAADPANNFLAGLMVIESQYHISWGIRGDNTPENAKYLGYLTSKELYPDLKFKGFEQYMTEVIAGKARLLGYEEMREVIKGLQEQHGGK
ncbi:hypothetical protein LTR86_006101 [Recurvomyces mirabilis]|nr:hypothetical protein LTR86_006101 [Recurvomyces mirabilis]